MTPEETYEQLKQRLSEIWDLGKAAYLLSWDQQTMMPPRGAPVRAAQLGTLSKLAHERFVDDEVGRLLEALTDFERGRPYDSDEASLIRYARREWAKERRVPTDLREEMTRAGSEAYPVWVEARRASDFGRFLPALERNVELRRTYAACFEADEPYDALLDDFEPGMKTAEVREVFARLKEGLVPLIAEASAYEVDASCLQGHFPRERQRQLDSIVERFGLAEGSWRIDPTEHPFAASMGTHDVRLTSRYPEDELTGIFATMHEYGHGLYEHQVDSALERTPLARGTSLALHESQSRMWENLVGRGRPFWRYFYPEPQRVFPERFADVDRETFHRAINRVRPSLIRIEADEATYNLHIILRFELEQEMLAGTVDLAQLPSAWNERMRDYLGVEVTDDAHGVLQDVHWARGSLGYFPTYALGNVISVQIWEQVGEALPDLDEQLERGEFGPLREWLREHVHRHGRKFTPTETLERVVGGPIDPEPYLAYLERKLRGLAPAA
ncbi:MAG: carboxypeptidase M32 [Gaiellaceae bacterium]